RRIGAVFVQADAGCLPLPSGWATVVLSGFALRNFVSLPLVFAETARVLAAGGRLALLEVDTPRHWLLRWGHHFYFTRFVPLLGALLADAWAYAYLPQSVSYLPTESQLRAMLEHAGFHRIVKRPLSGGIVQLITAERQEESGGRDGGREPPSLGKKEEVRRDHLLRGTCTAVVPVEKQEVCQTPRSL
ncbi:MAG: class I SAM-dependent methyltransferase, partial [Candidatus Binatia bacterium]|nr:class I SAM-dependent methyltransferase [Candidatus Binatia bacterium]